MSILDLYLRGVTPNFDLNRLIKKQKLSYPTKEATSISVLSVETRRSAA